MRTFVILTTLLACACGSNVSVGATSWEGQWKRTGTQSATCSGAPSTSALGDVVTITSSSDTTFQTSVDSCNLVWNLGGDDVDATLVGSQTCPGSIDTKSATMTFTKGSASLNGDSIMGSLTGTSTTGCSVSQQFTLTLVIHMPNMR